VPKRWDSDGAPGQGILTRNVLTGGLFLAFAGYPPGPEWVAVFSPLRDDREGSVAGHREENKCWGSW
jgi:hypothetical protein